MGGVVIYVQCTSYNYFTMINCGWVHTCTCTCIISHRDKANPSNNARRQLSFFPKRKRKAASGGTRARDVLRSRQTLYQLSHRGSSAGQAESLSLYNANGVSPLINIYVHVHVCSLPSTHKQQLSRLMSRDEITEEEAVQRIKSQIPLDTKCLWADVVIDNSHDRASTRRQVERLVASMNHISYCRRFVYYAAVSLVVLVLLVFVVLLFHGLT